MKFWTFLLCCALTIAAARAEDAPGAGYFDFENGTQGWKVDWGLQTQPEQTDDEASNGEYSLVVEHHFKRGQESIGTRAELDSITDFSADRDFLGFSAWIYFPGAAGWEAQLYVASGENWDTSWGELYQDLKPGWHRIVIRKSEISNPTLVCSIGIQVKNYRVNTKSKVYIDNVQPMYAGARR
jgi:hypothetical protein